MGEKFKLALFLLPLLAVGLVSFVIVRNQQGDGGTLVTQQRVQAHALTPAEVASVIRLAPETANGPGGRSATCAPRGSGELQNPWRCTISYTNGIVDQYRITLYADGSYDGDDQVVYQDGHGSRPGGTISGCCVAVP